MNLRCRPWCVVLLALAWLCGAGGCAGRALPAFPGAEGFGASSVGGRGGRVVFVTHTGDDGPGSLRAALAQSGPRTVVFRTGGVIRLRSNIVIREPFVTIAGQSAPGDGVCLTGGTLRIRTHDVIIRGLRVRVGDQFDGPHDDEPDGIGIVAGHWPSNNPKSPGGDDLDIPVYNVILDHCSISWAVDENLGMWSGDAKARDNKGRIRNLTVQWCILAEGLDRSVHHKGPHSMGMLVGHHTDGISVHHNLMANNANRNPLIEGGSRAAVINNTVYNWRHEGTALGDYSDLGWTHADVIGNTYLAGPDTVAAPALEARGVRGYVPVARGPDRALAIWRGYPGTRLYLRDNTTPRQPHPGGEQWAGIDLYYCPHPVAAAQPTLPLMDVTVQPVKQARALVLAHAGAVSPRRDAVDMRIVAGVDSGTGRLINSPADVGGMPAYSAGEALPDADEDGLPDAWETQHGLDPRNPADANRRGASGYTFLEDYLNGLIPPAPAPPATPAAP